MGAANIMSTQMFNKQLPCCTIYVLSAAICIAYLR